MRTLGNILWFLFGGLIGGLAWTLAVHTIDTAKSTGVCRWILFDRHDITSAPNGIRDSFAILKHCSPTGMPTIVMHQTNHTSAHSNLE